MIAKSIYHNAPVPFQSMNAAHFKRPFTILLCLLILLFRSEQQLVGAAKAGLRGLSNVSSGTNLTHTTQNGGDTLFVLSSSNVTTQVHTQRNLAAVQRQRVLAVRVNNPSTQSSAIYHALFSDVKQQMAACSANLVIMEPTKYGVIDISVPLAIDSGNLENAMVLAKAAVLKRVQGGNSGVVTNLIQLFDHVVFVLPSLQNFVATAEVNGVVSKLNSVNALSLSVLMHELGHNLGFEHAWDNQGEEYGDVSGYMGSSTMGLTNQCYNAGNHWSMGWYPDAHLDLASAPATPITVSIIAFTDYGMRQSNEKVLVRVGTYYMQLNMAKKHNSGTRLMPNKLVIVQQIAIKQRTVLQAGLDATSTPQFSNGAMQIRVCRTFQRNGVDGMVVSIGKYGTNCNINAVSSNPDVVVRTGSSTTNTWAGSSFRAPSTTSTWSSSRAISLTSSIAGSTSTTRSTWNSISN